MRKVKNILGILFGYFLLSTSLAMLFLTAKEGELLKSMLLLTGSWTGYLLIHLFENGELIDPVQTKDTVESLKENEFTKIYQKKVFIGLLFFITGVGILAVGISRENILYSMTGTFSTMGGYFTIHEGVEDKIA